MPCPGAASSVGCASRPCMPRGAAPTGSAHDPMLQSGDGMSQLGDGTSQEGSKPLQTSREPLHASVELLHESPRELNAPVHASAGAAQTAFTIDPHAAPHVACATSSIPCPIAAPNAPI